MVMFTIIHKGPLQLYKQMELCMCNDQLMELLKNGTCLILLITSNSSIEHSGKKVPFSLLTFSSKSEVISELAC